MKIALNYTIFAIIATVANIGSQDISVRLYSGIYAVSSSILVGTIIGLLVKYFLDKKYIFKYEANNIVHDSRLFILYGLMGVLTTLIFWGVEFAFQIVFQSKEMRYLGGVIGLVIGYLIKYQLDKRYVFIK